MWLVIGGEGQLGRCLGEVLTSAGREHVRLGRHDLNLLDTDDTFNRVVQFEPTVVVNAAAWTAVDDAEDHETAAYAINAEGARNAALAAKAANARFIHVSTDYVFDGTSMRPYSVDHVPAPTGAYGRTKLAGEQLVAATGLDRCHILRTAWLYSRYGKNFAKTMVGRALRGEPVRVVNDQRGQPTSAMDLSRLMLAIDDVDAAPGILHATNSGDATWYEFAGAIYEGAGADSALVSPTDSASYPTKAVRPKYSVLDHSSFASSGVAPMRHWREALAEVIDGITEQVRSESQK